MPIVKMLFLISIVIIINKPTYIFIYESMSNLGNYCMLSIVFIKLFESNVYYKLYT